MNKLVYAFLFPLLLLTGCNKIYKSNRVNQIIDEAIPEQKTNFNIKLCFTTNMEDPRAISSLEFKEIVESETNGRITVELYPDGQLGSDSELIHKLINNEVDMVISSAGNYAVYVPEVGISALPYFCISFDQAIAKMNSIPDLDILFNNQNIQLLSYFDNGSRCITTSEKFGPVNNLSDIKNLNIRTPHNQILLETMLTLEAAPKSSSFTTLKKDIVNGKFDAQENPIPIIYNSKLYEVQKYLAITNHSYDIMPFTIRKQLWDQLTQKDKEIILDAASKAQLSNHLSVEQQTKDYIDLLKSEGMIITYPNLDEFKNACISVINFFEPLYGDLIDTLKSEEDY